MLLYITLMSFVIISLVHNSRNMGKVTEVAATPAHVVVTAIVGALMYWAHWSFFLSGEIQPILFNAAMSLLAIYYILIILRWATSKVVTATITPINLITDIIWGTAYTLYFFKYVI